MPRRIYYDHKEIYDSLVGSKNDYQIFSHYRELFLLAATVGFNEGHNLPQEEKDEWKTKSQNKGEMNWEVFLHDSTAVALLNAIVLSETNELTLLSEDEESYEKRFDIIEQYANYGIKIIKQKVLDPPGDPLNNLINYVFSEYRKHEKKGVLNNIIDEM